MSDGMTVGQIAEAIGAELKGEPERRIRGAASLESARPDEVTFLASRKYLPYLGETRAAAVIVGRNFGKQEDIPEGTAALWVDDAHVALATALSLIYPTERRPAAISSSAIIEPGVELGADVSIDPYAVVREGARIGNRVRVGAHTVIGERCQIGEATEIREHVCLYPDTIVGARCTIHSGARLGVDGFGYAYHAGKHKPIPQVGRCVIEDDVDIGANCTIDRGSVGETRIGAGTKIDNLVQVGHNVRVGRNCLIIAQVGIAGSSILGDGVTLAGQVGVSGHLSIGDGARVAAKSGVSHDIPAGETWFGSPARPRTQALRASAASVKLPELLRRVRRLETLVNGEADRTGRTRTT